MTKPSPAVPAAWPRGLDYYRLLILLAAGATLASALAYAAASPRLLAQDPLPLTLLGLACVGGLVILVSDRPLAYVASAILVGLFPVVGLSTYMLLHLMDPLGGRTFIGALLALLSLVLALPAAIYGRAQAKRSGHTTIGRGWRTPHGTLVIATATLVLGAAYGGGIASIAARPASQGAADLDAAEVGAHRAQLTMRGFEFEPRTLGLPADQLIELELRNDDGELHTFTYRKNGTEYNHNVFGESTQQVWLYFAEPGTILFRCTPHSDDYDDVDDMVGRIEVQASG